MKKRKKIQEILGPQLHVVTLAEFFAIYDEGTRVPTGTNSMTATSLPLLKKDEAVTAIERCLATFEATPREPDDWERKHLGEAIDALSRGLYYLASELAWLARVPPERRSPRYPPLPKPIYHRYDIAFLRERLREAAAKPLRP